MSTSGSLGSTVLKGVVLFVIVAAGVFAGFWISVKSGLTDTLAGAGHGEGGLSNRSALVEEEPFPAITGLNAGGEEVDVASLLSGRRSVVGFVSGTCEPCLRFADAVAQWEPVRAGDMQVILFTESPEVFRGNDLFTVLEPLGSPMDEHDIFVFPTIIVVDPAGDMKAVSSGFSRMITPEFVQEKLTG